VPIIGVVENMSGEFFGTGAGEKLAGDYSVHFLGTVPLDANVRVGGDSGRPIVISHPESPAGQALKDVAQGIAARISVLTLGSQGSNFIPIEMIG